MAIATASDVRTLWGKDGLTTEETATVERRLSQLERAIIRRIPDFIDKCDSDQGYRADAVDIEADAVLRLMRNPDGLLSETDGSYTYMKRQDDDAPAGRLELTADEWKTLGYVRSSGLAVITPVAVMPS
ncbi:Gp19/Gp15/Gp42 family protein [Tsukamurella sp. 8F]|uniref:Gp19/Gp15/Gp42 family protein n=1 Tax=unclassified Tsukamurella TaxID=2633480 RepID=UPI0023B8C729|nr:MULTISPECIES: Gp19/Gp15/Gp42 family protein [unclassified Tsukamurella]MDF0531743.1 Gp19/Gp15/Gp42 family protein [Tsukamurella sp. 8J]MDF0589543.1 Gp19/Gp15/Gp42 family protein [Tsukamurella sp. 8F]